MFNELLTRPITESGFNSINSKIDENKKKYIYLNGVEIIPVSVSPSNAGTYSENSNFISMLAQSFVLDSVSSTGFATTSKISLAGYSRIWFLIYAEVNDNYYKGGVNLFVDESVRYCYDIGNTTSPQAYTRYISTTSEIVFGSINITSIDKTKNYYVGVNVEHWNSSSYNLARVYAVYLQK